MPARHRDPSGAASRRRPAGWLLASGVILAVCGALVALLFGRARPPVRGDAGAPAGQVRGVVGPTPTTATPTPATPTSVSPTPIATKPLVVPKPPIAARVRAAAKYAEEHGLRAGVAVLDLESGQYVGGGYDRDEFAAASVMKVFIAAELLADPGDSGATPDDLTEMIEQSDDAAATTLWPRAGGSLIVDRMEHRFHLTGLGSANTKPGFWGNTHITARGLVRFYAAVAEDPQVGRTLLAAMRNYSRYAADGTDQSFGVAVAHGHPAIKQGWAAKSADTDGDATVNSTGVMDRGRFAVAILTEGHDNDAGDDGTGMNLEQRAVVTHMARLLTPQGWIDPADAAR